MDFCLSSFLVFRYNVFPFSLLKFVVFQGLAVRVTTVDKHDIYHISDVDMTTSEASPRPLMTITTTMKEIIQFAPFVEHPVLVRRKVRQKLSGTDACKHPIWHFPGWRTM